MTKKNKQVCGVLTYIEHLLILISTVTGFLQFLKFLQLQFISFFTSLVGVPIGITSSAIGLKFCVIPARIKEYKSVIRKKKKKHDKIVLLAKHKINSIEVLISKALISSNISHDKFVLINVLKEFYDMKKEIKNSNDK